MTFKRFIVRVPGRADPANTARHRKVLLKLGSEVLTFPITSREVQITEISPEWVQIARPGQRPLLRRASERLRQVQLEVVFVKAGGQHVEVGLQILRRFANHGAPLAFSYGPSESGMFHVTDLRVRSMQREFGTNNITQAEVSLTLTEAFKDGYQKPTAAKPAKATPAKAAPKPAPAPAKKRIHVVQRGDTLSKIAARYYGNANRFGEIAKANGIRNPNRILPGQRLVIP